MSRDRNASRVLGLCLMTVPLWGSSCALFGLGVPDPKPLEVLETGFRDPAQTFRTFQTAMRGNLLELEYKCFSDGFRQRNGLSQAGYRLFRDELIDQQRFLRLAVHKAEITGQEPTGEGRVRLEARTLGRTLVVDLVREVFWEIWAGSDPSLVQDGFLERLEEPYYLPHPNANPPWIQLQFLPTRPELMDEITELRMGQEWKIDHFQLVEDES